MTHDAEAEKIAADARRKCRVPGKLATAIISILLLIGAYPLTRLLGFNDFQGYLVVAAVLLALLLVFYLLAARCAQRDIDRQLLKRGLDRVRRGA